jgi:peptidoglycan/xylan/chitin deacetylase (PgdA/CDA1 family)
MITAIHNYIGRNKARVIETAKKISAKLASHFRPGLTVLLYHRITNLPHDPQLLSVSPERFEEQLVFLKKIGKIITVNQFEEIIRNNIAFPPKSFLITFDDGYADNYIEALPILERQGVQAIFFVSTSHIDTKKEFWWDNLERIFLLDAETPKMLEIEFLNTKVVIPTSTKLEKVYAYRKLHKILKPLVATENERIIQKLLAWANLPLVGRETHRVMTTEELKKLSKSSSKDDSASFDGKSKASA